MISVKSAAEAYLNGNHQQPTELELIIFSDWLKREFLKIQAIVRFTPSEVDPAQMLARFQATGQLLISSAHNDSIWLTGSQNVQFRAVHDFHHLRYGLTFGAEGEYMAFEAAASEAPSEIHWILRSEIWLQAAAAIHTGLFQPQKLVNC